MSFFCFSSRQILVKLTIIKGRISAICPALPRDSALLTLPFGGAVLQSLGIQKKEIENILEDFRKGKF